MVYAPVPQPPAELEEDDGYGDARAADDDSRWRGQPVSGVDGLTGSPEMQKAQCEEKLKRVLMREGPRALMEAIRGQGCTALKPGESAVRCRICPSEAAWSQISGYYSAQKGQVVVCAEKEPTEQQIEETVMHELVLAYDHCRMGMRVPFVGIQAPWALSCAATACSEVRGQLRASLGRLASAPPPSSSSSPWDAPSSSSWGASSSTWSPSPPQLGRQERDQLYLASLASLAHSQACRGRGGQQQAILDAVFDPCLADQAPFASVPNPTGARFPPLPPAVEQAEAAAGTPVGRPPPPLPSLAELPNEEPPKPRYGEA